MKQIIHSVKSSCRRAGVIVAATMLAAGIQNATAQSIGLHVVTGNVGGIDNSQADALLPAELAGVTAYAQTNWNNISGSGGSGTFVLTNSLGAHYSSICSGVSAVQTPPGPMGISALRMEN